MVLCKLEVCLYGNNVEEKHLYTVFCQMEVFTFTRSYMISIHPVRTQRKCQVPNKHCKSASSDSYDTDDGTFLEMKLQIKPRNT